MDRFLRGSRRSTRTDFTQNDNNKTATTSDDAIPTVANPAVAQVQPASPSQLHSLGSPNTEITIEGLQHAADDATFDAIYARVPDEHKARIDGVWYVKYDPYRKGPSKNSKWFTKVPHAEDWIRATKGTTSTSAQLRGRVHWKCGHCNNYIVSKSDNNDSKKRHLQKHHHITENGNKTARTPTDPWSDDDESIPIRQNTSYVSFTHAFLGTAFKEAIVSFVVICQLSLSLMVNDLFIELLKVIYPTISELLPRVSNTIKSWVIKSYQVRKERLKEDLSRALSRIHFSFDLWTSPNHLALLGIVAHYIDHKGNHQTVSFAPV